LFALPERVAEAAAEADEAADEVADVPEEEAAEEVPFFAAQAALTSVGVVTPYVLQRSDANLIVAKKRKGKGQLLSYCYENEG
jgi:hypothetical protein